MTYQPRWDRVAHMNAGKARRAELRNRGYDLGSVWERRKRAPDPEPGSWERFNAESQARFEGALIDFLEDLKTDLYGPGEAMPW